MTATAVSRGFSAVLDATEEGETFVVTRGGRPVAEIRPVQHTNGNALRATFARWRADPAFDDAFVAGVHAARTLASSELDDNPWHD